MKLFFNCIQCFNEKGKQLEEFVLIELRDDGLYKVVCSKGHTTFTSIQQQKFEILFDSGTLSLLDGYPREAIASVGAALERLLEFYIKVICLKHGIELPEFNKAWKEISSQSERQYGAFHFLNLIENKKPLEPALFNMKPDSQTKTWSQFRNDVMHKGYIPSSKEAFDYIEIIYKIMLSITEKLKKDYSEYVQKATIDYLAKIRKPAEGENIATMSIPTLISLVSGERPEKDFKKALETLKRNKKWLYH